MFELWQIGKNTPHLYSALADCSHVGTCDQCGLSLSFFQEKTEVRIFMEIFSIDFNAYNFKTFFRPNKTQASKHHFITFAPKDGEEIEEL